MDIEVKFDGEEIMVTKPGTDFMLAFRKRPDQLNLVLTRSWIAPHHYTRRERVSRPSFSGR
jgi:hypothetical protein